MSKQEVEQAFGPPFRQLDESPGRSIWLYRWVKVTLFDSGRFDTVLWFHGGRLARVCDNRWEPRGFIRQVGFHRGGYERHWQGGKWIAKRMSSKESARLVEKIDSIEPHAPVWSSNTPAKREDRFFW